MGLFDFDIDGFYGRPRKSRWELPEFPPINYTPSINDLPAAAEPPQKASFFGPGGTGRGIAGLLGDFLLQQNGMEPIYSPMAKQRQLMEYEEQQRQRERAEAREDTQWEWQNKPKDPYLPDAEKQAQYYESIGDPETAADVRAKARMVPVQQADPNTGEVRYQYVRPTTLMGGVASAPKNAPQPGTVEDGYMFKGGDPAEPSSWVPVGGGAGFSAPRPFR